MRINSLTSISNNLFVSYFARLRLSCCPHSFFKDQQGQNSSLIISYEHFLNMSNEQKDRMCSGEDVQQAINQFATRGKNNNTTNNNSLKKTRNK